MHIGEGVDGKALLRRSRIKRKIVSEKEYDKDNDDQSLKLALKTAMSIK